MAKHPKRPRDPNQWAKRITDIVSGEVEEAPEPELTDVQKFAQQGGLKGGKARANSLTPSRRAEIARAAAKARWANKKS